DRLLHRESTAGAGLQSDDRAGGRHAGVDRLVPASWPGYLMYLVTGGSGFCGFEIVKLLSKNKHIVRIIDVEPPPQALPGVDYFPGDIRDSASTQQATRGVEVIIHSAAKVPISKAGRGFWEVNVRGTRNVLEA